MLLFALNLVILFYLNTDVITPRSIPLVSIPVLLKIPGRDASLDPVIIRGVQLGLHIDVVVDNQFIRVLGRRPGNPDAGGSSCCGTVGSWNDKILLPNFT